MARAEVQLALNATLFQRGISAAERSLAGFGANARRIGGIASSALSGIGLGLSATGIAAGVKRVLELGDSLTEMRDRTGIAIKDLVILQEAFRDAGLSAEDVGTSIGKMQRSIVEGSKAFETLGLKTKRLIDLGPSEQFRQIGQAIAGVENPAKRAALAIEVFGKAGAKLLPVFQAGANASQQVEWQAEALAKNADAFGRVADKMKNVNLALRGFFIGVVEQALPTIEKVLDRFDKVNWEEKGKSFAKGIETAVSTFDKITTMAAQSIKGLGMAGMKAIDQFAPELGGLLPRSFSGPAKPPALERKATFTIPPDFWRTPDPRNPKNFFKDQTLSPFMNAQQRMQAQSAEWNRRFPRVGDDPDFVRKFSSGSTEGLERWAERMGVKSGETQLDKPYKSGGYHLIRRGDAERAKAAAAPQEDKIKATIADESMDRLTNKFISKLAEKVP